MDPIGQVKRTASLCEFEWRIPEFSSLATKDFWRHRSPDFEVLGKFCYLCIYSNYFQSWSPSTTQKDTRLYFDIHLWISLPKHANVPEVSYAIKNADGNKAQERHDPRQRILLGSSEYVVYRYISRAELLERASELMPSNILTVICTVRYPQSMDSKIGESETSTCTHCKGILDAKAISFHEKNCWQKPVKCPECSKDFFLWSWSDHVCQSTKKAGEASPVKCTHCQELVDAKAIPLHEKKCLIKCPNCSEVVTLKNWNDHECQTTKPEDVESLIEVYKKVLLDGRNHDLILKIGDVELRAHRDILRARSHVFQSMLDHDMKEKESGVINVHDCDPQAMELFLSYIYTGKVEPLDQSNMLRLYYVADKYDMQDLKDNCCEFIKKSLSISNICDVIQLALSHSNTGLLEYATEYFMENTLEIMVTVEWQTFQMNNATVGNELLIKSIRKLKDLTSK